MKKFIEAYKNQERNEFLEVCKLYSEILKKPSKNKMNSEYNLMVLNNYAVSKAEYGDLEESEYLLQLLLKEKGVRKEIVYYNLAQLYRLKLDSKNYKTFLSKSYENDDSLYRVRNPYILAIDNLSKIYSTVNIIDMHKLIPDDLFLDHCHPLPEGQVILADEIQKVYSKYDLMGKYKANIKNILYNPEYANGNNLNFNDYFKTLRKYQKKM